MFDIGWSELLVIAVVAIIVVGPKDLPRLMRTFGQYAGKLRRMATDFQHQFDEAVREAELEELREGFEAKARGAESSLNLPRRLDPMTPKPEAAPPTTAPANSPPTRKPAPKPRSAKTRTAAVKPRKAPTRKARRRKDKKP
jgi:sec-independent protein translocase protein TatB